MRGRRKRFDGFAYRIHIHQCPSAGNSPCRSTHGYFWEVLLTSLDWVSGDRL